MMLASNKWCWDERLPSQCTEEAIQGLTEVETLEGIYFERPEILPAVCVS
jgi:hypothetical protein